MITSFSSISLFFSKIFFFVNFHILFSEVDPALIPYYLHPVKIYQIHTDPETNYKYMDLKPSDYPEKSPASFNVDWTLGLFHREGRLVSELRKTKRQEKELQ